ncbi:hypothetical protein Q7C30_007295 [Pseudomonas sp. RAC1]|uniref:hypothetical protein n=1 Tax=Pseudomonas sp. RAC1 TaxID=3064900 RepID=UPI00272936B4|nr:hypothetical protein [Pseudomonas sp. RAC1]MDV9031899.1 hypothetical protein [Pseudomonas sp. RAC1]
MTDDIDFDHDADGVQTLDQILQQYNQRFQEDDAPPMGIQSRAGHGMGIQLAGVQSMGVQGMGTMSVMGASSLTPIMPAIYIPGHISGLKSAPRLAVGINRKLVYDNPSGLLIVLQAYDDMRPGDWVEVFWNDSRVSVASMVVAQSDVGNRIALFVRASKVPEGTTELWYQVKRVSGVVEESTRLTVISQITPLSDLSLLVPEVPASGFVGPDDARQGVKVHIPPYDGIRQYDQVEFAWGTQKVSHTVTMAEVTNGINLVIDERTLIAAGNSERMALAYRVIDEVGNISERWSQQVEVPVRLVANLTPSPYIANPDPTAVPRYLIDLDQLGGNDLQVEVDTVHPSFKLGDSIRVTLTGSPAQGPDVTLPTAAQPIRRLGRTLFFAVSGASLLPLRGGRASASYENLTTRGFVSGKDFAVFAGLQRSAIKPELVQADADGNVDPSLTSVTVQIPVAADLQRGDRVTLVWLGTRANGTALYEQFTKVVNTKDVGLIFTFPVADGLKYLAPLDGGKLDLSYQIQRRGMLLPLYSEHQIIQVGQPQAALPAARMEPELINGIVDPNLPQFANGLKIHIDPFLNMNEMQDVSLQWLPEMGPPWDDSTVVWPGEPLVFEVPHDQLMANFGGSVQVRYFVTEPGETERYSDYLDFVIDVSQVTDLEPVEIPAAQEDNLDPGAVIDGALIVIPASVQLQVGDFVDVYWDGSNPGGVTVVNDVVIEEGVSPEGLVIEYPYVIANLGGKADVRYEVTRLSGSVDSSLSRTIFIKKGGLPQAYFLEGVDGHLNPGDVPDKATVRIGADAKLQASDKVTIWLEDEASNASRHLEVTVPPERANRTLDIDIPAAYIEALDGSAVNLRYEIKRSGSATVEQGGGQRYVIQSELGSGTLQVFGARYSASAFRCNHISHVVSAFNAATGKPILAQWLYEGDQTSRLAYRLLDRQPHRPLLVRTATDAVWLNTTNVLGTGIALSTGEKPADTRAAFVAMLSTSKPGLFSLCSWGAATHGGALPSALANINTVVEVSSTRGAFAARLSNGKVHTWGNTRFGGQINAADADKVFLDVRGNVMAFAGRVQVSPGNPQGRLACWGNADLGGALPAGLANLTDIVKIYSGRRCFVAERANGSFVAWGDATAGATLPASLMAPPSSPEQRPVYLASTYAAFAARLQNGTLIAWGNPGTGGSLPAQLAARRDIASLETASEEAFCALTNDGHVVVWGGSSAANVPPAVTLLDDIVEVSSNAYSFCARRRGGHVVTWGSPNSGGTLPPEVARLSNIVQVTGSTWAFAALCSDGSVVAWGDKDRGGQIPSAVKAQLTQVRAIYANTVGFTALTADGRAVTWGEPSNGGNSASVQAVLNRALRYGRPGSGHAVAPDNDLRALA